MLTAYLLSASVFTPILGRLGDMTGKKRMFVVALIALAVGCLLAALAAAMFLVGLVAGRLAERFGSRNLVVLGSAVSVVAFLMLAFQHDHKLDIYLASAILGIGFGLAFAAMANLIVAAVPPAQTGVASGMNANIRTIGGSLGAAFMASVVTSGAGADGLPKESGYQHGFLMLGGAAAERARRAAHPDGTARRRLAPRTPGRAPSWRAGHCGGRDGRGHEPE